MRHIVLLAVVLCSALALAQDDGLASLGLGPVVEAVQRGHTLYLALEQGGVAVVDASDAAHPKVVGRLLEGRLIFHLAFEGEQLVVTELRQEELLQRFSLADPLHPVARALLPTRSAVTPTVATTLEPAPVATGPVAIAVPGARTLVAKVVDVKGGRVMFDSGTEAGFAKGQHVRVLSQQLVTKPDLSGEGTVQVPSGEVTAVLTVEQAGPKRAMAMLGRGDIAATGDLIELTTEPLSERLALPRRAPFTWRAGFLIRPFLGLNSGSKPVGVLADGFVTYTFAELPLTLGVALEPLGFALNSADRHYPVTTSATAAYTTDYFEIGLGAGALVGNSGPCPTIMNSAGAFITTCEVNTGFTINQTLRLGALDGLHLEWHSSVFSRPEGFVFGVGRAEAAVPLTSRLSLFAGGGAGENGWGFGELGVRTFISGAGAPGTIIFSASLGGAGIFDGHYSVNGSQNETVAGPSVAFGAEWRL